MIILAETEVARDLSRLDAAWSGRESFVFAPEKSGLPAGWLEDALARVPEAFRTGHFALLTSGSTGRPKLSIGSRERAEGLVRVLHHLQESEPVEETVVALPLTYCYSFVNQWVWSRVFGRKLVVTPGLAQPDRLRSALREARGAMLCLVGAQVPLLGAHFEGEPFPGVLRVHFAGGRFPQEKLGLVGSLFPRAVVFNNYGCAEAMPRLTLRRAEEADVAEDIGRPLPGVEMRSGPAGELLFRSPYGAVGYVDDAGFQAVTPETWVPTGDLGEPGTDGRYRIVGRAGELFKRHGEKVSLPSVLDTVRSCWPGQAAPYRERDPAGEEGYVLVLSPPPSDEQVRRVLRGLRERHPRAQWPLRVEGAAALPLLPNGKIDALALAAPSNRSVHWHQRIG